MELPEFSRSSESYSEQSLCGSHQPRRRLQDTKQNTIRPHQFLHGVRVEVQPGLLPVFDLVGRNTCDTDISPAQDELRPRSSPITVCAIPPYAVLRGGRHDSSSRSKPWEREPIERLVHKVGSFQTPWFTAVVISIDRFPQNRPKIVVYLLIVLGLGTPA